jgi:transposase
MARSDKPKVRRQEMQLVTALASGRNITEAADLVGVSASTVRRRLRQPDFRREVRELRGEMFREAAGLLARSSVAAVYTLVKLLKDDSRAIQLQAARSILEYSTRFGELIDLTERVSDIESRLGEAADAQVYSRN